MNCERVSEELIALVQGELEPAGQRKVRSHLQDCARCRDEKAAIEAVLDLMSVMIPPIEVSADFDARLEAKLAALPRPTTRPSTRRRVAADEPRGMAFVAQYLRHRVRTAPILAASILLHFTLLSFLTVLVVHRAGGGGGAPLAWQGIPSPVDRQPEVPLKELDLLPRDAGPSPKLPEINDEEPELAETKRSDPLDSWVPQRRKAPSEVAGWLASRIAPEERLERAGARESIPAIRRGLKWLATRQTRDGSWRSGAQDQQRIYTTGVTALSLLTFLAQGHAEQRGAYHGVVGRGLAFLRGQQSETGLFGPPRGNYLYNHIVALQALAENMMLGARDADADRARLEKGMRLLVRSQHLDGVWGYQASATAGTADSSVTGWAIFVLDLLRRCGVTAPAQVAVRARGWFRNATDASGRVGYRRRGDSPDQRFTLTCVGLLSGRLLSGKVEDPRQVARSLATALADLEREREPNYSLWYHTTYALRGLADAWNRWEPSVRNALLLRQTEDGSWAPDGLYGKQAGRAYTTAIALLTLQVHYRYR